MEKELRKKLEQDIANNLKSLMKELNPAAFDKMEKHIEDAAHSLAKRFVKVRNKLNEAESGASAIPANKTLQKVLKSMDAILGNEKPAKKKPTKKVSPTSKLAAKAVTNATKKISKASSKKIVAPKKAAKPIKTVASKATPAKKARTGKK
jgi:hypothetical protein